MKIILYVLVLCGTLSNAQSALYNSGNLQIHQQGTLGFHTNLINNGSFDENVGLVGFYGDLPLTVSGAFTPSFFDVEIANPNYVLLNTGINTLNNTNFILGNFKTPRTNTNNYFNFAIDATYNNSGDITKVDGYAAINNKQQFTFPVGDEVQLRQLILNSEGVNNLAKCAYFYESPDNPSTFSSFNTSIKEETIELISAVEFWRLEGSIPSTVQLSWNERSSVNLLTDDPTTLIIVGWNKARNQWQSLAGNTAIGDSNQGIVSSIRFIPNDYEVLTLASATKNPILKELITVDNYLVTPNGDGNNDSLIIPELVNSPNNSIQIYNRYGLKVFEMQNYTNEFQGYPNTGSVIIEKEKGLPSGVYFFIIEMKDVNLSFQGFLYLAM